MKNMTIKTFITFMFLSLLIMGTVYLTLFLVTPYSSVKKNREYIEIESQTLADKCMNLSKAEAERLIHGFASRTGTYTELLEAENYLEREDSMIEESYPLHFSDQQQEYMLCITRSDDRAQSFRQNIIKSIPTVLIIALIAAVILAANVSAFRNWLVYAVTEAEAKFGGKTGKLKLRYVYDLAVEAFPVLAKTLPFSFFSWAVDSALLIMRGMIEDNAKIADIVNNEDKE